MNVRSTNKIAQMNLQKIKESFITISNQELATLLPDIADMHPGVLQAFHSELIKRGMTEEIMLVEDFIIISRETQNQIVDREDIHKQVRERIENGDTIEEIKYDLKMQGIDILRLASQEQKEEDSLFHIMTGMKENGLTDIEINKSLNSELGFNEQQSKELISELEKRGKQNITIGNILIGISIALGVFLFYFERISFTAIGVFAVGIWRHQLGKKQLKQN